MRPLNFCSIAFLVIFSFLISHTEAFVSERLTEEDKARYVDLIMKSQDSETLMLEKSLQSTAYGLRALTLLGKDMPEKTSLCSHLSHKTPKKDGIFLWIFIVAKLDCSTSLPAKISRHLQQAVERPKFNTVYLASQAVFALIDNGKMTENEVDFAPSIEILLSLMDDSSLMRETLREKAGSSYKTGLALELFANLHQRYPDLQEEIMEGAEKLQNAMPALMKQGKKTGGGIIFQGSLTATVTVLNGICQFYKSFDDMDSGAIDVAIINRFGKYILNNKFVENVTGIRMILVGIDALVSNNVYQPLAVHVVNPEINLAKDDGKQFVVSIVTINGANIQPDKLELMKLTQVQTGVSLKKIDFKVSKDNSHILNLRNAVTEAGLYEIVIDLEHGDELASIKRFVRVVKPAEDIKGMVFDFSKRMAVNKVPEDKKTKLDYPQSADSALELNNVREARLEVSVGKAKPEQMVAVFTYQGDCKGYQVCSFSVAGTKKSRKYQWRMDLSKADYKHFMDGTYSIKVIIGDVFLSQPVEWKVGTIQVHKTVEDESEKDYEPVDDVKMYWHAREEIQHTFEPPPNQPNQLLALVFTAIVGSPFFLFIVLQTQVFGQLKIKSLSTYDYLFQIAMMMLTLLLFTYWTSFGLVRALSLLLLGMFGLIAFGFNALKGMNKKGGILE